MQRPGSRRAVGLLGRLSCWTVAGVGSGTRQGPGVDGLDPVGLGFVSADGEWREVLGVAEHCGWWVEWT